MDPSQQQHQYMSGAQQSFPPPPTGSTGQPSQYPSQAMNTNQQPASHVSAQPETYYPPPPPGGPPPAHSDIHHGHPPQPAMPSSIQNVATSTGEYAPPLPQRHDQKFDVEAQAFQSHQAYNPAEYTGPPTGTMNQPPPQRLKQEFGEDDPSNPIHYIRDPHKLIAYLVPFPKPQIKGVDPTTIPPRFMIYTPPPPPLSKPAEGEKEAKLHKVQRKWQEEVRSAKTSTAKTASWQGVKSKATRGINWAMNKTTSSNLDFLGRVSPNPGSDSENEGPETHKTVGVDEMILIYPPTMNLTDHQMREEFVNTMLRAKSKAQRDTIIATGLMPVGYGIDILATFIWPFGGLGEIDTVWAYASFRGAKTARSVTKRLSSSSSTGDPHGNEQDQLRLTFTHSQRIELLRQYLDAECHKTDAKLFPTYHAAPTESNVLEAIGWSPSQTGGEKQNWEDEQWEMTEVKDDFKSVMHKAAREWKKWCVAFEKDPEKALKK